MEPKTPRKTNLNISFVMEEKIDRLENHFKVYKLDMIDVKSSVQNIETALIGSDYNGNKGIVILLDEVNKRVKTLEDKQILQDDFVSGLKWFQRGVIGVFFAWVIWLITK